jgi:hypothetical protein
LRLLRHQQNHPVAGWTLWPQGDVRPLGVEDPRLLLHSSIEYVVSLSPRVLKNCFGVHAYAHTAPRSF